MGVGVVGLAENKANSAPIELELELGLSLAINKSSTKIWMLLSGTFCFQNAAPRNKFKLWKPGIG